MELQRHPLCGPRRQDRVFTTDKAERPVRAPRSSRPRALALTLGLGLGLGTLGLATGAAADPLKMSLTSRVSAPDKPRLTVIAEEPLDNISVAVEPGKPDGAGQDEGAPSGETKMSQGSQRHLGAGQKLSVVLGTGRVGSTHWHGVLQCTAAGKLWKREVNFDTQVTKKLEITFDPNYYSSHLNITERFVEVQLSEPAGKAELQVFADDGSDVGSGARTFAGEAPGTWLRVPWTGRAAATADSVVLRLALKLFDSAGNFATIDLYPWAVTLPHEDVNFASNAAEIPDAERGKLDESYRRITTILDRVERTLLSFAERGIVTGSVPRPKLFVSGHTDTVGGDTENLALSRSRARAIASYFRQKGFKMPIYFVGYGERQTLVKTPDNTDNARNRRADYTLALEMPPAAAGLSWIKL